MTALKSRRIAKAGEQRTARYLEDHGYTILERNWRFGRYGELDLIARGPGRLTVFVEVKTRTRTAAAGIPTEGFDAVDRRKQKRIIRAARSYLLFMGQDCPARFDVAVVTVPEGFDECDAHQANSDIAYVESAFHP